jgi:hypothetical protein
VCYVLDVCVRGAPPQMYSIAMQTQYMYCTFVVYQVRPNEEEGTDAELGGRSGATPIRILYTTSPCAIRYT